MFWLHNLLLFPRAAFCGLTTLPFICIYHMSLGKMKKIRMSINNSEYQCVVLCTVAAGLFVEI